MTIVRCDLDMEHEAHPHAAGDCDGQPVGDSVGAPDGPIRELYTVTGLPLRWAWASLTLTQAHELYELLVAFVGHYNRTWAVKGSELIPGCWPLHPGLADELPALYALWVHIEQSGLATPQDALDFRHRWLPAFRDRLPRWLGASDGTRCNPTIGHRDDWNETADKLDKAAKPGMEPAMFADLLEAALRDYTNNPAHLPKE